VQVGAERSRNHANYLSYSAAVARPYSSSSSIKVQPLTEDEWTHRDEYADGVLRKLPIKLITMLTD